MPRTIPVMTAKARRRRFGKSGLGFLLLLPATLLLVAIVFYPIFNVFRLSLERVSSFGTVEGYVGLANFQTVWQSHTFWLVAWHTLWWTLGIVIPALILSLVVGLLLSRPFWGRGLVRTLLMLPWATSLTIMAIVWTIILAAVHGPMNEMLRRMALIQTSVPFLAQANTSFPWMIFVGILVTLPFAVVTVLAGLNTIPGYVYEAAMVDGATTWVRFWAITLPLVKRSLLISGILNTIYVFNSFPIIWVMTGGGPANTTDVLTTYMYREAFRYLHFGPAAAMAVMTFLLLLVVSFIYLRFYNEAHGGE